MTSEIKPEGNNPQPPAGGEGNNPQPPNPNPSDEQQKKIKELEEQIKKRDAELQEAQTTLATIEARKREVESQRLKEVTDADTESRIKKITESMAIDPQSASTELALLLKEVKTSAQKEAVREAMAAVQGQTVIEKIRLGVKTSNPDFDDDLVNDVMDKANMLASTGKYKTPEDAVKAANEYVRSKLESFATKKNASPQLPAGANGERGGGNPLPPQPPPEKEKSPLEELNEFNEARRKKAI